jgi:hypothetical protein
MGVHLTPQARLAVERAEESFHLMAEPLADEWFARLKPGSRSLRRHYAPRRERAETYEAIVNEILAPVRKGRNVCAAFYGHPGVFATPSHEAIRRARAEGFSARMLPSISADDCLFADLGVDPGLAGCQSYEATDFIVRRRTADPTAALILWQVGFIGVTTAPTKPAYSALAVLADYLREFYDASQEMVLYEASPYPIGDPRIERLALSELADLEPGPYGTLYVPPAREAQPDPALVKKLALTR